jgi:DNA-binding response OmpR family regulator
VRALLRRIELDRQAALTPGVPSIRQESVTHGPLRVDPAARIATLDDAPLDLTPKEFDLLLLFVSHPNRAFSRAFLLEQLWSDDFDRVDRVVDSHITRLRKKLGDFGERIVTVWSVGYRFEP